MEHDVLCGIAFHLKPCTCETWSRPELYREGFARQRVVARNIESELYFTSFVAGYVVRCGNCSAHTDFFETPEEAVKAWNEGKRTIETFREALDKANDILKGAVGCQEDSLSADTPA